jgi:hypothetical protein
VTAWWELDVAGVGTEVRKALRREIPLAERDEWETLLAARRADHERLTGRLTALDTEGEAVSWVWNVVLSFSEEEFWEDDEDEARETCAALERINGWIPHGELVSLTGPTCARGAGYGMTAHLYGGGFKHFDIEGFIEVVEAQAWKDRAHVQLWLKGETDACFAIYPLRGPAQVEESR